MPSRPRSFLRATLIALALTAAVPALEAAMAVTVGQARAAAAATSYVVALR